MAHASEKTFEEAMALPAGDRLLLVERLLDSLTPGAEDDIQNAWIEEVRRRIDEVDRGEIALIDGEDVFERIRSKYTR